MTASTPNDWGILGYDVMYIIAGALEKAGSTDPAALREALGAMAFDTLRGELRMRTIDNTFNAPSFIGVTRMTDDYPFPGDDGRQRHSGRPHPAGRDPPCRPSARPPRAEPARPGASTDAPGRSGAKPARPLAPLTPKRNGNAHHDHRPGSPKA